MLSFRLEHTEIALVNHASSFSRSPAPTSRCSAFASAPTMSITLFPPRSSSACRFFASGESSTNSLAKSFLGSLSAGIIEPFSV